jgi:hypothetical protein
MDTSSAISEYAQRRIRFVADGRQSPHGPRPWGLAAVSEGRFATYAHASTRSNDLLGNAAVDKAIM